MALGFWLLFNLLYVNAEPVQVHRTDCAVIKAVKGKWFRLSPTQSQQLLRQLRNVDRIVSSDSKYVVFDLQGVRWATQPKCVTLVSKPPETVVETIVEMEPVPQESLISRFEMGLELYSWQEALTLSSSVGSYPLNSAHIGPLISAAINIRLGSRWSLGLKLGGFLGRTEVAESSGTSLGAIQYRVTDAWSFGGLLGPRLFWRLPNEGGDVGLWAPLVTRFANWPTVSDGGIQYVPTPLVAIFPSVYLDFRLRLNRRVNLTFSAGFVRSFAVLGWMTGVNVRF